MDRINKACIVISTQAGERELSSLPGTTCCVLQEKFPRRSYNKSFIDQAGSVKMVGSQGGTQDFLGFEIFDSGIFLGTEIWKFG